MLPGEEIEINVLLGDDDVFLKNSLIINLMGPLAT